MTSIRLENQQLLIEQLHAKQIAGRFGTPCYVYSKSMIENRWLDYQQAFGNHPHLICYAVKANSNIAILQLLAHLGSGFDIVSQGELERVLQAGGDPKKIVFSGVGKQASEIERALDVGILCFNVESHQELSTIQSIAKEQNKKANISIRVNPNINPRTHPYISTGLKENKFGIPLEEALEAYQFAQKQSHLSVKGIDCHIGSQLTEMEPFTEALTQVVKLVGILQKQGIQIQHLDIGGGLGITYQKETPPEPGAYIACMLETLKSIYKEKPLKLLIEPGRSIVGNAGVLLTEVLYTKETPDKNFAIVDAGMNDLMRPALYQAWQNIVQVEPCSAPEKIWDIVGPVCESGDFLGKNRPLSLAPHSLLAILSAGAYGFSMTSNYNTRNRPAEILVDREIAYQIRRRETFEDQTRLESLLPGIQP
jgi:diaminopimelate decarboxylase